MRAAAAAYRCDLSGDSAARRVVLRSLASTLAGLPPRNTILVEQHLRKGCLWLVPSGPLTASLVQESLRRSGLPEDSCTLPRVPVPYRGQSEWILRVEAVAPRDAAGPQGHESRRPWLSRAAEPASVEISRQSFWSSTGDPSRLLVLPRERLRAESEYAEIAARLRATRLAGELPLPVRTSASRATYCALRDWDLAGIRWNEARRAFVLDPQTAADSLEMAGEGWASSVPSLLRHTAIFGATGSGKTTRLAEIVVRCILGGHSVAVLDLHGDLGPAILDRLPEAQRRSVVAIDAARAVGELPGMALIPDATPPEVEAHRHLLVAALRRLGAERGEAYWGARMERLFDSFVRLVPPGSAALEELHRLLTDGRAREAARLSLSPTDSDLGPFLEELEAILRRNPEFLWSAAARVSKVALTPRLAALFRPTEPVFDPIRLVVNGRSIVWRLPVGEIGPEGAALAGSLLFGATYLGLCRRFAEGGHPLRALLVVDEAHLLAPRLLAQALGDARKFGVGIVLATQYPDRFDPELRAAVQGTVGTHLVQRVPAAAARSTAPWAGLSEQEARELLPSLGPGFAVVADGPVPRIDAPASIHSPRESGEVVWESAVGRTRGEFGPEFSENVLTESDPDATLFLLLARSYRPEQDPGTEEYTHLHPGTLRTLAASGLAQVGASGIWELTEAGERRLGLKGDSGAWNESELHRILIARAFRIFARHGERLELLRQGRFDTQLPDARLRLIPARSAGVAPIEWQRRLEARSRTWAWKMFWGRDVHVEAEVSGARRPERIRRGLRKAEARAAFALFVVANAADARRVRRVLNEAGAGRTVASVWTLSRPSAPADRR